MKNKPLVSIIMPVFNADKKYVTEAIESVLKQTYNNLELIICDDCSTDNFTPGFIKQYCTKDNRIKYIRNEKNLGPFRTLDNCFSHASGEFVLRVDADDVINESHIEKLYNFLVKNELDIACSSIVHINGKNNIIMEHDYGAFSEDIVLESDKDYAKLLSFRYLNQGKLIKKDFIVKQGYSFFKHKELTFIEMFFYDDCKVGFVKDAIYYYRIFGANNSEISKACKNNKNPDNYFDEAPIFDKISSTNKRIYAEMFYFRARYPLAFIRALNKGKEYNYKDEIIRLKKITNYKFSKMKKSLKYFSKRNKKVGYFILFRLDWLFMLITKIENLRSIKRVQKINNRKS